MLKPRYRLGKSSNLCQPPSGGCVLKPGIKIVSGVEDFQPPSGGCVLKHTHGFTFKMRMSSRLRAAVC